MKYKIFGLALFLVFTFVFLISPADFVKADTAETGAQAAAQVLLSTGKNPDGTPASTDQLHAAYQTYYVGYFQTQSNVNPSAGTANSSGGTGGTSGTTGSTVTGANAGVCTGNIFTDPAAAQDCANKAQAQAKAMGYTASCTVNTDTFAGNVDPMTGKNYTLNTVCTVNGFAGNAAYLLAGYQAPAGSNAEIPYIAPGWDTLKTELGGGTNSANQTGSGGATSGGVNSVGGNNDTAKAPQDCSAIMAAIDAQSQATQTATTPPSVSAAQMQALTDCEKNSASQDLKTATDQVAAQINQKQVSFLNTMNSISNSYINDYKKAMGLTNTTTTTPTSPSAGNSGLFCYTFNSNLGVGSSGADVSALQNVLALENVATGSAGGAGSSATFDETLASAVSAFQQKYAGDILTPLGLTSGTGYVGPATRTKLNALYGCHTTVTTSSNNMPPNTVTLTANGQTNITVNVGDTINYVWNASSDITSVESGYYSNKVDTCPGGMSTLTDKPWVAKTTSGSDSAMVQSCQAGVTYTIYYKKAGDSVQGNDLAQIIVKVNPLQTTTTIFTPPTLPTPVFTSNISGAVNAGDSWNVIISSLKPSEAIYETGGKEVGGVIPTDKTQYNANMFGVFAQNGVYTINDVGDWHMVFTRADGTSLGLLTFSVQNTPTIKIPGTGSLQ